MLSSLKLQISASQPFSFTQDIKNMYRNDMIQEFCH